MRHINCLAILAVTALMTGIAYSAQEDAPIETKIKTMLVDPRTQTPVLVLETVADKTLVPIWIDVPEAKAIALELIHVPMPRPLTHDLIRNILEGVGATLQRVTITDIRDNTYFAVLTIRLQGKEFRIDSRPSDAIAIALRMKAPTYISSKVLAKAKEIPAPDESSEQLKRKLGIQAQDLTRDIASLLDIQFQPGVLVADVTQGSRAESLGIERGDVITKVNGHPVQTVGQLESLLRSFTVPGQLQLELIKKGKPTTVVADLPFGS
jgi:uncharacterized protein